MRYRCGSIPRILTLYSEITILGIADGWRMLNALPGRDSNDKYKIGGENVFKDIGLLNAEEHFIKAQLVFKIDTLLKRRKLKQVDAANLFGIRQPDVSNMLCGEFRQFSVERLLRFLVALDQDVEIVVRPHRDTKSAPDLHVS